MNLRVRRIVFPVAAVVAVFLLASTLSPVLSPVMFAALLAVILNPVVDAAARFRLPRVVTVSLLYVALLIGLALGTAAVGSQFTELVDVLRGEEFYADYDGDNLINLATGPGQRDEFDDRNGNGAWDGGALVALRQWINLQRSRFAEGVWGDVVDQLGNSALDLLEKMWVPATAMLDLSRSDWSMTTAAGLSRQYMTSCESRMPRSIVSKTSKTPYGPRSGLATMMDGTASSRSCLAAPQSAASPATVSPGMSLMRFLRNDRMP